MQEIQSEYRPRKSYLVRATLLVVFLFFLFAGMFFGSTFLIPIFFGGLLAMLMLPIGRKLESWKIPRSVAILLCILLIVGVLAGIVFLLFSQIMRFTTEAPAVAENLTERINEIFSDVASATGVSEEKLRSSIDYSALFSSAGLYASNVLMFTSGTLMSLFLVLTYLFFFMYYRERLNRFVLKLVSPQQRHQTRKVISDSGKVAQHYLGGMLLVSAIMAVINGLGLMLLGVPYAWLFGAISGILNFIPYIGAMLGGFFPVVMIIVTGDSLFTLLATISLFTATQMFEDSFLLPKIVGPKVSINPFAAVVALLLGLAIWGVPGMILFIPYAAILKIVFDHVHPLKPYGYLLGEEKKDDDDEDNDDNNDDKERSKAMVADS